MSTIIKDLGPVSAYAYAVEKGYTGTEEEFAELMADYADVGQTAVEAAQTATTKASEASASATTASTAATTATTKASEATTAARTASTAASTATTKASEANTSAGTAAQNATTAVTKASEAATSATAAANSATAAEAAQTAAETAQTAAETAQGKAEDAAEQAEEYADRLIDVYPTDTASGSIASFPDGADGVPVKSLVVNVEPSQDLHGYDNPWPAGGGKNLLNPTKRATYDNGRGQKWYETDGIVLRANRTYTMSVTSNASIFVYFVDKASRTGLKSGPTPQTYAPTEDTEVYLQAYANVDISSVDTFQLELGSTATAYSPYSNICPISGWDAVTVYVSPTADPEDATTYPITFPSTVYGGTDEIVSGSGINNMAMVNLGNLSWTLQSGGYFEANLANVKVGTYTGIPNAICSHYKTGSIYSVRDSNVMGISVNATGYVYVRDPAYADAASFKTAMLNGNAQLVYEVENPTPFTTTPVTDLVSQYGQNNIFADCGDTSVTYRADIQLYIDKLTGSTEDDMTADSNIPNNTYFLVGNTLYKSTAAIEQGATIVPGTNCTKTDLAAALNALQ